MKTQKVLGLSFFEGDLEASILQAQEGGLLVAPSAPILTDLAHNPAHREALEQADLVLPDSGLMVLLWNLISKKRLIKISGYLFLKRFLDTLDSSTFWVMPREEEMIAILQWLKDAKGLPVSPQQCYLAPFYQAGAIDDQALLELIQEQKPKTIIINIGGGVQERLGLFLRKQLDYKPTIICTGAALAFLAGTQAAIPLWVDRFYLGWLARCLQNPKVFVPRYWNAFKLVPILLKYKDKSPAA